MKYLILPFNDAETFNADTVKGRGAKWGDAKWYAALVSNDGLQQALMIGDEEVPQEMTEYVTEVLPDEFIVKMT